MTETSQDRLDRMFAAAVRVGACEDALEELGYLQTPVSVAASPSFPYWVHWMYHRCNRSLPDHVKAVFNDRSYEGYGKGYGGEDFHQAARDWLLAVDPVPVPAAEPEVKSQNFEIIVRYVPRSDAVEISHTEDGRQSCIPLCFIAQLSCKDSHCFITPVSGPTMVFNISIYEDIKNMWMKYLAGDSNGR